jgi:hypothetical protein
MPTAAPQINQQYSGGSSASNSSNSNSSNNSSGGGSNDYNARFSEKGVKITHLCPPSADDHNYILFL